MKIHRSTFISYFFFLASPFLSIPFLLAQLKKGIDKGSCFLIAILMAMLSFRYIPNITNDKSRYIERYETFSQYSIKELIEYLTITMRPDFLFDLLNYFFSKAQLDIRILFFLITFFTVYSIFTFTKKTISTINNNYFSYSLITFFLIFLAFPLPGLFSGIRFIFAGSLFIWFIYYFHFKKSYIISFVFLALTISTHFSYSFLAVAILLARVDQKTLIIKIFLFFSILFMVLPKDLISNILSFASFSPGYINKVEIYTDLERESSNNHLILNYIKNIWFYISFLFLLFYKPEKNIKFYTVVSFLLIFINITYSIPVAFYRYLSFFKIIFAVYLIYIYSSGHIKKITINIFIFFYLLGFLADILVLRVNFLASYSLSNIWSILYFFYIEESSHKFIY